MCCGILTDCPFENPESPPGLPDSPISQVEAFLHSIKSESTHLSKLCGPTVGGILYPTIINQLNQFKGKKNINQLFEGKRQQFLRQKLVLCKAKG